jgi:acylphosphatase
MAARRLQAIVHGRVQMVGFRYFVVQEARRLSLTGWVRNADDGATVEVVAEGPEEALRRLEEVLRDGPPGARVDGVDAQWSEALDGYAAFAVRR